MTASSLRSALQAAMDADGCTMKDLTVLAPKNDSFRLDTLARHRHGRWLADTVAELGLQDRRIHLRGLHYAVLGRPKPDGTPYLNHDDIWDWLQADAAKAARFLGYLPFGQITDQRNAEPVIQVRGSGQVEAYLTTELDVTIPQAWELGPQIDVEGFEGTQPYRLALVGEKSSLADIPGPLADRYDADLFLPTGEISATPRST